jgi:hypothetical protein
MEVGFPPSIEINSGVFQRETRKLQWSGSEGFRREIVRREVVRLKVGSVILDTVTQGIGVFESLLVIVVEVFEISSWRYSGCESVKALVIESVWILNICPGSR